MLCSWFPIGHLPSYGESAPSVRPFQAVLNRAESPVILLIPFKKKTEYLGGKTFTASATAQITHWNSSGSSCVAARYSNKTDEILTGSGACNLKHNHISDRDSEEKKKANLTSHLKQNKPARSLYSTKEITKIVFGSDCNISVRLLPFAGHFQAPLHSHRSGEGLGWDGTRPHVCRVPVTRLRGYQTPIPSPGETDSDSSVRVRLIWLVPLTRRVRAD